MSPRSRSLAAKGRDSPSNSAASVGVSVTSAGMVMTDRPAARLFAALTTNRSSDAGRLISVPSAVRSTSSPPPGPPARRLSSAKIDGNRIDPRGLSKNTFARHPTGRLVRSRVEAVQYELLK
jgi:hypothetical protein